MCGLQAGSLSPEPEMHRAVADKDEEPTECRAATCVGETVTCVGRWPRRHQHRQHRRPRFRCVAPSPPSSSPESATSGRGGGGGRLVGCVYRRIRVRSRCTSRLRIRGDRCDVIGHLDHVVDVDYFRSVSVQVDRNDVIACDSAANSSNSSSSSSDHDVSESMMKSLPVHKRTGTT